MVLISMASIAMWSNPRVRLMLLSERDLLHGKPGRIRRVEHEYRPAANSKPAITTRPEIVSSIQYDSFALFLVRVSGLEQDLCVHISCKYEVRRISSRVDSLGALRLVYTSQAAFLQLPSV